ncbi:MAG TPA: ribonuclease H [Cellvibrio sp.]|nr:ribonuclease H [Cellvibrio sp.]
MFDLILFTDGSVDTKTRIGFGAYLAVGDMELPLDDLKPHVKVKQFENTSSTKLELQTLLWAIDDALLSSMEQTVRVVIYSDSQNIAGLPARRNGLEQRDYFASNGKRLHNAELYQQFFKLIDRCDFQIIKVEGHKPQRAKSHVDHVFTLVDKASRSALREFNR